MTSLDGAAVRARITQQVRENPGIHFREIARALGLSPGQASHHLHRLLEEGFVVQRRAGGYAHFFANGAPLEHRAHQAALRQASRRAVALAVRAAPLSLRELSHATGYAESTLHHHVRVLQSAGVLAAHGTRPVRYALRDEARAELMPQGFPPAEP